MLDVACRRCGMVYHADKSQLGQRLRCCHCGTLVKVAVKGGRQTVSREPLDVRRKLLTLLRIEIVLLVGILSAAYYVDIRRAKLNQPQPVTEAEDSPPAPATEFREDSLGSDPWSAIGTAENPAANHSRDPKQHAGQRAAAVIISPNARRAASPGRFSANGTRIIPDQARSGNGELNAVNSTSFDACIMVVRAGTRARVRQVYIQPRSSVILAHLNPEVYKIVFTTGFDWDEEAEHFRRAASYFEFAEILAFSESQDSKYVQYDIHTITLNIADGNDRSRSISECEFHALSGTIGR
jgi:hypothetical protein